MTSTNDKTDPYAATLERPSGAAPPPMDRAITEYMRRVDRGESVQIEEFVDKYPNIANELQEFLFMAHEIASQLYASDGQMSEPNDEIPQQIARYRVTRLLGSGGFGYVLLARDEQLDRDVAIKIPKSRAASGDFDIERCREEARTVATLDHPNIVPIHDIGETPQIPFYMVSKFIPGADLDTVMKNERYSLQQVAALIVTIAEALDHAHNHGIVHRDIKPANILVDNKGSPYIVDFGLALSELSIGRKGGLVGTPAYMSPEQVRAEGHRVDRRTDVFSLGVILYELLTGQRPFQGETAHELFEQILNAEPLAPSQFDGLIPAEIERICLKSIEKRAQDRYMTAQDLADDVRHFTAMSLPGADAPLSRPGQSRRVRWRRYRSKIRYFELVRARPIVATRCPEGTAGVRPA